MRVVVAGGGIAALEVLAGLRALAGERVTSTLVAPVTGFSFRPLSTAVPFTFRGERTRTLAELASGLGARFVHDGLTLVDESRDRILTGDGDFLPYDALVMAVGSRPSREEAAARTWARGREGTTLFTHLLPPATERYLSELSRVLRPGGRWLATFFLIGEDGQPPISPEWLPPPGWPEPVRFQQPIDHGRILDPDNPERAVAHEEDWLREAIERAGLSLRATHRGYWPGRHGLSYQDVLLGDRSPARA